MSTVSISSDSDVCFVCYSSTLLLLFHLFTIWVVCWILHFRCMHPANWTVCTLLFEIFVCIFSRTVFFLHILSLFGSFFSRLSSHVLSPLVVPSFWRVWPIRFALVNTGAHLSFHRSFGICSFGLDFCLHRVLYFVHTFRLVLTAIKHIQREKANEWERKRTREEKSTKNKAPTVICVVH